MEHHASILMTPKPLSVPCSLTPIPVAKPHFPEIDQLRAIGCIMVTVYHAIWKFKDVAGGGLWLYDLLGQRDDGFQGFLIFFIISGYVIPESLRGERIRAVKRFAISRFFRLYPSFLLVIILGSLIKYKTLYDKRFWWGLTMQPSLAGVERVFGHFWALEVTTIFYVTIALIYLLFGRVRLRAIFPIYLFSLLLALSRSAVLVTSGMLPKLPILLSLLFFGACLRKVVRPREASRVERHQRFSRSSLVQIGAISGLMAVVPLYKIYPGITLDDSGLFREFSFMFLWLIAFLAFIILPLRRPSFLETTGKASYSIYIWHMPILHVVILSIKSGILNSFSGLPLPVYVLTYSGLCLAFGGLAYRYIEQPIVRIGKRITNK